MVHMFFFGVILRHKFHGHASEAFSLSEVYHCSQNDNKEFEKRFWCTCSLYFVVLRSNYFVH